MVIQKVAYLLNNCLIDINDVVESSFRRLGWFEGGNVDYILALTITVLFPVLRFVLDRTLYDVSSGNKILLS